MKKQFWSALAAATAMAVSLQAMPAGAQEWPTQPITLIVPFSAGGGSDPVARLLADGLGKSLGQPILVEFRPGGSATIGSNIVAHAKADGYTILMAPNTPVVNVKYTIPGLPYDVEDLVAVTQVTVASVMMVANVGFAPNTFAEVIDYAKANSNKVNLAIQGTGGVSGFAAALMESELGVEFNKVPYKGSGDMRSDLMSGVVDIGFGFPTGFLPGIDAGKLKFIAALAPQSPKSLPDVKTTEQEGFGKVQVNTWLMIFAPKGTPADVQSKISDAINAFIAKPEVAEKLERLGYGVTSDSSPAAATALLEQSRADFAAIIESGAMKVN